MTAMAEAMRQAKPIRKKKAKKRGSTKLPQKR